MEHDLPEVKSALTQQNVEPETRAQFLQYACELTLNPDTAHEDLVVSKGDKEVNIKPQGYKFTSVRYPERFMYRRQVLCREGLQAERCYYEVEVEGDKVEIALAYKTIDRKSRSERHPRIGVYLKFKEGTLSFYEVSDSMKFLYRVEAKFTDLLYPGFWLGEKSFIRICDLRQQKPQET
ncbi:hypothetical protein Q5P01_001678 [Channa striata]|uniref:SPRY-associated domain-containing protein n=1 Tax=Channa striata TaxID=64152 RepID=A0AA88TCX4_CHASR|nr:hypothetical protein Q5P01_001678 [Channa striata]